MTVSPFDSRLLGPLLSDPETAERLSDEARIRTLVEVEEALARAGEACGAVPSGTARAVARAAKAAAPGPELLGEGAARDGTPVPALVAALREAAGGRFAPHIHRGATSQDIEDTAFLLRVREVLDLLSRRLARLERLLASRARRHRGKVMAGRTRFRQATPVTFALKVASWRAPLVRHRRRLEELRPRLLAVQLGGASGTLSAFGGKGVAVMERLARELGLEAPAMPWHTQRDSLAELAGWLALVSGSLGKMGLDLALLAQSEVEEVRTGPGGGSSTMPHKSNPVGPEVLAALARTNAGLLANVHQAMLQEHERGGAGLAIEWLSLPSMMVATGAALRHAEACAESMEPDPARMRASIAAGSGLVLAEAARDALAQLMPRARADETVREAAERARREGRQLLDVLAEDGKAAAAVEGLGDPGRMAGAADELLERALGERAGGGGKRRSRPS